MLIQQAERDLPGDRWENFKGHWNGSRSSRARDVAFKMLADIKPRLQTMSVTDLIRSFKVVPYPAGKPSDGFHLHLLKIKQAAKRQLGILDPFAPT